MSNKPKIYGHCAAGCKWETVHRSDLAANSSLLIHPMYQGKATLDVGTCYKIEAAPIGMGEVKGMGINFPTSTAGSTAVTVGEKIYLFGCDEDGSRSGRIQVYDTVEKTLSDLSVKLPLPLSDMSVAEFNGKIYIFGGYANGEYYNKIYCFDIETETIAEMGAYLPLPLGHMGIAKKGSFIYLIGGIKYANSSPVIAETAVYRYAPLRDSISMETTPIEGSFGVCAMGAASVNNQIYICGGKHYQTDATYSVSSKIYRLKDDDSGFEEVAELPEAMWGCSVVGVGNKLFIFGGDAGELEGMNTVYCYDVVTGEMEGLANMLAPAYNLGVAAVGARIYVMGGGNKDSTTSFAGVIYTHETHDCNIVIRYKKDGVDKSYVVPITAYDAYRNRFTFEPLALSHSETMFRFLWVYEINGERYSMAVIEEYADEGSFVIEVEAKAVYAVNEGLTTIGRTGLTGAIPEVETLPENPDEFSPTFVRYDGNIYVLTEDGYEV